MPENKDMKNPLKVKFLSSFFNIALLTTHLFLRMAIFLTSWIRVIQTSKKIALKKMKLSHLHWIRKTKRNTREFRLRQIVARRIENAFLNDSKEINLADCMLSHLPKSFYKLEQLEIINLSGNRLTQFESAFRDLENITSLDLSRNKFTRLPVLHLNIHQPFTLDISHNMITTVPQASFALTYATCINLACNRIKAFPNKLEYFENLKQLDISYNPIETLPECFSNFTEMTQLNIAGIEQSRLRHLPPQAVIQ